MTKSEAYTILGLSPGASEPEIKKTYFHLIRHHSPEKDPERFMDIREAYEYLTNPSSVTDDPDSTGIPLPVNQEACTVFHLTEQLADKGQFGSAVSLLEGALQAHPDEPGLLYLLAGCQYRLGHAQKAAKAAEQLVRLMPENLSAWEMYAQYLLARGWMSKAQKAFEKGFDLGERSHAFLGDCYYVFRENRRMDRVCQVCDEIIRWNLVDEFDTVFLINAWSDLASFRRRDDKELQVFLKDWLAFLKKYKKQVTDTHYGLNPFYGLLRKEKEDNSFTLERVRLLEKAADQAVSLHPEWKDEFITYKEVLYNHVLWDDPRNLSEYWAHLVASICCDTDEKANDSKLRRFSQLDIQLCMLRERDRILSEMDIIRKDYPFVYDRHREFLDQLQSDDPEKMKKKLEWEFNKQSGSYAGSFYRELLGIPEKHETMRPAFPDFPDLPFAPDEDNGSAPLFPEPDAPFVREKQKIGRNDPCPCGSGKKFKNCCLGKGIYD